MSDLLIIGGPNGAGKTTAAKTVLPRFTTIREFVNADEIARGLSPFNPDGAALSAGRIMLKRMDSLIETCTSFAFETTCAGRGHYELIQRCQKIGYRVTLLFFWLPSVDLALARVARRVSQGGHDIPSEVIKRRYHAGLTNLVRLYWPIVQDGAIFDAEYTPARDIIEKSQGSGETVHNPVLWQTIQKGR